MNVEGTNMKKALYYSFLVLTLMGLLSVNSLMFTSVSAQAGTYPTEDGNPIFTLHLTVLNTNPARIEYTYMIAESLQEIGIEAEVHVLGWDVLFPL